MRKASRVVGLIGGILSILFALLLLLGGTLFAVTTSQMPELWEDPDFEWDTPTDIPYTMLEENDGALAGAIVFLVFGGLKLVAGILGIVGASVINRNHVTAGVLMLVGSFLSLITFWGFIAFVLLLLGGIFALVKESSPPLPQTEADGY